MTHATRHGGAKNCALSLDGEHERQAVLQVIRVRYAKAESTLVLKSDS